MAVYFIRSGSDGPVKIGYSADSRRRLSKIQSDTDRPVSIINEIDGGKDVERWLHWRFRHLRIRGEWFTFDNAMHTVQSEMEGVEAWNVPFSPAQPAVEAQEAPALAPDMADLAGLIAAFGSRKRMARALGLPKTTVMTWFQKGSIPAWRHDDIRRGLAAQQASA